MFYLRYKMEQMQQQVHTAAACPSHWNHNKYPNSKSQMWRLFRWKKKFQTNVHYCICMWYCTILTFEEKQSFYTTGTEQTTWKNRLDLAQLPYILGSAVIRHLRHRLTHTPFGETKNDLSWLIGETICSNGGIQSSPEKSNTLASMASMFLKLVDINVRTGLAWQRRGVLVANKNLRKVERGTTAVLGNMWAIYTEYIWDYLHLYLITMIPSLIMPKIPRI